MEKKTDDELEKRIKSILGDFDATVPPPKIFPVAEGVKRPTWSVMIPTYNCAKYLTKTLESVLEQDPGPEHMQIEVVDDCSTLDDPEKVVREVGKGRVAFHRNPKNSGYCTLNFNICIQRSIGHLVHILHGDDYVLPGFYDEIKWLTLEQSEPMIFSTRAMIIDEQGDIDSISARLSEYEEKGSCNYLGFIKMNPLLFPGIVIKREFFEATGGFTASLLHCADWEMWVRATDKTGLVMSNKPLSAYRYHSNNDTSKFVKNADNLKEYLKLFLVLRDKLDKYPFEKSLNHLVDIARLQEAEMKTLSDIEAAARARIFLDNLQPSVPSPKNPKLKWLLHGIGNKFKTLAERIS